jgi:hypothetical protein
VLKRAVMEVKAEACKSALARTHQRMLSRPAALDQKVAFGDHGYSVSRFLEQGIGRFAALHARDQRAPRRLPAPHGSADDQAALAVVGSLTFEQAERNRAKTSRRRRLPDRDEALGPPACILDPHGCLDRR